MVLGAMHEAEVAAADTIVVGDTVYDIAMARAAGAGGLGVPGAIIRLQRCEAGALAVIDTFPTLVPALDKIWTT